MPGCNPFDESTQFSCPKCDRDSALELKDGQPTGRVWCDKHGTFTVKTPIHDLRCALLLPHEGPCPLLEQIAR
jgi:hypothetical protein